MCVLDGVHAPFAAVARLYPFAAWPGRPVATRTRPRSLIIICDATVKRRGSAVASGHRVFSVGGDAPPACPSAVMTGPMNPRSVRPAPSALGPAPAPRIAGREPGVAHPDDTGTPCRARNLTREPHATVSCGRPSPRRSHDGAGGLSQGTTSQAEFTQHPPDYPNSLSGHAKHEHAHPYMSGSLYRRSGDTHNPADLLILHRSELTSHSRFATAEDGGYYAAGRESDSRAPTPSLPPSPANTPVDPSSPPKTLSAKRFLSADEPTTDLGEKHRRSSSGGG